MTEKISKKDLRADVELLTGRGIYSTANIKGKDEYRMSIPWHGGYRRALFADVPQEVWEKCNTKRDQLIRALEVANPQLRGHITTGYHIGAGIYLSLRVSNGVLA